MLIVPHTCKPVWGVRWCAGCYVDRVNEDRLLFQAQNTRRLLSEGRPAPDYSKENVPIFAEPQVSLQDIGDDDGSRMDRS